MGVRTDIDRKVAIEYDDQGVSWTVAGMMAATKAPSGGFETGQSYTPNSTDENGNKLIGSIYMAADRSEVVGVWPSANTTTAVDGGIVEITSEPLPNWVYRIATVAGETVKVGATEWTKNNAGNWEVDLSGRLETPITEVASINLLPPDSDSRYTRINIDQTFKVVEIVNEETGEKFNKVTFEQATASAPETYRTKEDWQQQAKRNEELYQKMLDRFEKVESDGGGGLFGGGNWLPTIPGLGAAGTVVAVVLGFFGLNALSS
jgi:hypothetical protein